MTPTSTEHQELITPALAGVDAYLDQHPSCTEHDLIRHCQVECIEPFDAFDLKQNKALFSAHFLMMHVLYTLQDHYCNQRSYALDITSIRIIRTPYQEDYLSKKSEQLGTIRVSSPLKDYYLNIRHYFETSEQEVEKLLSSFWQRFLGQGDKIWALDILGLPATATYPEVKRKYKELAQRLHPDKGGDTEEFKTINTAKNLLDQLF